MAEDDYGCGHRSRDLHVNGYRCPACDAATIERLQREREEIRAATLADCVEIAMAYPLDRNAAGSDDEKAAAFCIASRIRALAQDKERQG